MKKKILFALLPILALSACEGGATNLYGKTFKSVGNEVFYNLNVKYEGLDKNFNEVLKEKLAGGKLDWTQSGNCTKDGTLTAAFTQTTSYDSLIGEMETRAKQAFADEYKDLSIVVGNFKDGQATGSITKGGKTKEIVYKPYGESGAEDATFLYMYEPTDLKNSIGEIDGATVPGAGCINGKWDCICLLYEGVYSRTNYRFTFTDMPQAYKVVVNAKIKN